MNKIKERDFEKINDDQEKLYLIFKFIDNNKKINLIFKEKFIFFILIVAEIIAIFILGLIGINLYVLGFLLIIQFICVCLKKQMKIPN